MARLQALVGAITAGILVHFAWYGAAVVIGLLSLFLAMDAIRSGGR